MTINVVIPMVLMWSSTTAIMIGLLSCCFGAPTLNNLIAIHLINLTTNPYYHNFIWIFWADWWWINCVNRRFLLAAAAILGRYCHGCTKEFMHKMVVEKVVSKSWCQKMEMKLHPCSLFPFVEEKPLQVVWWVVCNEQVSIITLYISPIAMTYSLSD